MSWKKAQFGDQISWCGWDLDFALDTIALAQGKLHKLQQQLRGLLATKKVSRKALQQCLGLLVWATGTSAHLRPQLAPRYRDLNSPPGTMYGIHAQQWRLFLDALSTDLHFIKPVTGLHLPLKTKILEYAGRRVYAKADLPPIPRSAKPQYIRASNPDSETTALQKDSKECVQWLLDTFQHTPQTPLADPPCLICFSAADARADGDIVGIGGWIVTSSSVAWFAESWHMDTVRGWWPFLTKRAQTYIASFEALAQLVLLQAAYSRLRHRHATFKLPSGSDNTAATSGSNTLFTTSWPLSYFLRLTAGWAHTHNVALQVSHISGKINTWADELSRERLGRFAHRAEERFRPNMDTLRDPKPQVTFYPPEARWGSERWSLNTH